MNSARKNQVYYPGRFWIMVLFLLGCFFAIALRAYYLQVVRSDYLQRQADARHLRVVKVTALRGMILDRNGDPLAISTPVDSVWAVPSEFKGGRNQWPALARLLGLNPGSLGSLYRRHADREFMYLKRQVPPALAQRVLALNVPGVALRREYKRYYPAGAMTGHVVGFTDVDDHGQEGLEYAFDEYLSGQNGEKLVIKDGRRNVIENVKSIQPALDGQTLVLSLDTRLQYLASRALSTAVAAHGARAGSLVILDSRTGELLAMVNAPDFNPNNRSKLKSDHFRNRAVTDVFEPGSTIKPFTIATAIESRKFGPDSRIDTSPGWLQVGRHKIHDARNYGLLTVSHVVVKSSNVGASKIALQLTPKSLWSMLRGLGSGRVTGIGLPGEASGNLAPYQSWRPVKQATIAYGYGLSMTALQLAQAYTSLANGGVVLPVSLKPNQGPVEGHRVMSVVTSREVNRMLELAVGEQGTGIAAQIPQYRTAGKTGTVHKVTKSGYAKNRYMSIFAGFAPASRPRLVAVVMIDEPTQGGYFGGQVAAPVFGQVMTNALRLLNVAPDAAGVTFNSFVGTDQPRHALGGVDRG
ncbi:MAG: penicillin-binding protein 2 [Gammaproteobacteria bacterium]|nr:penicillin-binding protein 2 [Gammaproteobacteria bacterium]